MPEILRFKSPVKLRDVPSIQTLQLISVAINVSTGVINIHLRDETGAEIVETFTTLNGIPGLDALIRALYQRLLSSGRLPDADIESR